jgi:hypothetical protein
MDWKDVIVSKEHRNKIKEAVVAGEGPEVVE